ncbi:hypothetical protein AAE026_31430 [Bradyrhizobium sp. DN5]|uniref:hypothetical protein n=1 Tax=Bradyrhizobium sp. DN5 TaxID=3056950 RepID=UPI00352511B2
MKTQLARSLGIMNLERGPSPPKPRLGNMLNPATFDFPVIEETVEGGWADAVVRGNAALEPACIAAAKRLVERGAVAISANCGFFMRHQAAVAAAVTVPVVLSSLLLLPTLLRQFPRPAKLAVLTADSTHLGEDLLEIENPEDRARVVIGGIEGGALWRNEMRRPPVPTTTAEIEEDVRECILRLRAAHPEIASLLFECTGFPAVATEMRSLTGLPIYDVNTLCRMAFASAA